MKLSLRHIRPKGNNIFAFIELIVESDNTVITEEVTENNGEVDSSIIENLREIADTLEEQNIAIKEQSR